MAVTYPADLSGLKFSITSPNIYQTIQDFIAKYNDLDTSVQDYINDLKSKIDALEQASDVDIQELQDAIAKIKDAIDKANSELDIVGAIDTIADILNKTKLTTTKRVVFNSDTGKVEVDISDFGFNDASAYEVFATPDALTSDGSVNPAVVAVKKIDGTKFELHAFDRRNFVEVSPYYTEGATAQDDGNGGTTYPKAFEVVVGVVYGFEPINLQRLM